MARDLVLDVIAKKNSKDLTTLADEFDKLAKKTDAAGQKMNETTTFSKYLDEQLLLTKQKVHELGVEFDKTGDKDIFAKLRGADRNLKSLERIKADLTKALGDAGSEASDAFSNAFSGGFVKGLGRVALSASPALAPMAAMLAAELLAGIGGAISGGAGIGGILAGAITQVKTNPDVQSAAKDFGYWLGDQWKLDVDTFADPTRDAIALLKTELRGPMSDLRKDFEVIAPYTRDFANNLGRAAQKFMPGLNALLQNSGPLIQEVGRDVEMLAEAGSRFFYEISKGGKGEAEALDTLVRGLSIAIVTTGKLIHWSADLYDQFVKLAGGIAYVVQNFTPLGLILDHLAGIDLVGYVKGIGGAFDDSGPKVGRIIGPMASLTREAENQKKAVDGLTKAWDDWFGVAIGVDQANLRLREGMTALTDSIAQNGSQWELNTKAGQANYGTLLNGIQAAHDYRDAQIASGVSTAQANAEYQKSIDWLLGVAGKAGLSAGQIANLRAQVGNLNSALNSLDGKVVNYSIIGTTRGPGGGERGYYQGLATGGRADAPGYAYGGGVIKVGEMGPEYLSLPSTQGPAYVTPNSAINGAANGGGQVLGVIEVRVTNAVTGELIRTELVNLGRSRGYSTVDALLPVGSAR